MIRDKYKDKSYFDSYISYEMQRILKFEDLIAKVIKERGEDQAVKRARLSVFHFKINLLTASYSRGDSFDEIKLHLNAAIDFMTSINISHSYVETLWILSMGILLDVPSASIDIIISVIERDILQDHLLDYLIAFKKDQRPITDKILFEKPYKIITEAIKLNTGEVEKKIKFYLEKYWYSGHKDCGWYDSHKSKSDTYSGYWSFETAAIVKIMNLDDGDFKDYQYYPQDLLNF